jgi:hypothetical protein
MQQQDAMGDSAHARQLVGSDDGRRGVATPLCDEMRSPTSSTEIEPLIVKNQPIRVRPLLSADCDVVDEQGSETELDGARVDTAETSEAVQQRGGASAARAEDGDALSMLDVEARTT